MKPIVVSLCFVVVFVMGVYLLGKHYFKTDYQIPDISKGSVKSVSSDATDDNTQPVNDVPIVNEPNEVTDSVSVVTPSDDSSDDVPSQEIVESPVVETDDSSEVSVDSDESMRDVIAKAYHDLESRRPKRENFATQMEYLKALQKHIKLTEPLLTALQKYDLDVLRKLSPADRLKSIIAARKLIADNHPEDIEDFNNFIKEISE